MAPPGRNRVAGAAVSLAAPAGTESPDRHCEIRDARPEECEAAWALQRAVFDLPPRAPSDAHGAGGWFPPSPAPWAARPPAADLPAETSPDTPVPPGHPHGEPATEPPGAWSGRLPSVAGPLPAAGPDGPQQLRVLVREGRVVSCLTLFSAPLCLQGALLPMAGIRHVATHPEERNKGYASALIRDTLRECARRGLVVSVLFPFSFRYYRKFGYELGGNVCHFWCRPNCIPAYAEQRACRAASPEDAGKLARFHAAQNAQAACAVPRSEARWEALCGDSAYRVILCGETPEGYAVLEETRDGYGGRVARVLELAAATPAGWRGLLGHLARLAVDSVEWYASAAALCVSGLLRSPAPLREGFKPRGIATIRPMFQFRVVDLEGALAHRATTFPPGSYRLALRVRDDLLSRNERPLTISAAGGAVSLRPAGPSDPYLEADIRVFSQIFCGYLAPSEAVSQGLCRASSAAAIETAERLFPPGEPFISELDRF